jgi:N-acetylmuramoyl-L-alanine amidase
MKIIRALLTKNKYSRPGSKLKEVKGIVIHYVQNTNTTAMQNRNYFELRKNGKHGYGSAHYIIDLNGDVAICIPPWEVAYHVGAKKYKPAAKKKFGKYPNLYTIGIECTHCFDNGEMTNETYETLVYFTKRLMNRYDLTTNEIYLHFDITSKNCHKWFVDNPDEWKKFKKDLIK